LNDYEILGILLMFYRVCNYYSSFKFLKLNGAVSASKFYVILETTCTSKYSTIWWVIAKKWVYIYKNYKSSEPISIKYITYILIQQIFRYCWYNRAIKLNFVFPLNFGKSLWWFSKIQGFMYLTHLVTIIVKYNHCFMTSWWPDSNDLHLFLRIKCSRA